MCQSITLLRVIFVPAFLPELAELSVETLGAGMVRGCAVVHRNLWAKYLNSKECNSITKGINNNVFSSRICRRLYFKMKLNECA